MDDPRSDSLRPPNAFGEAGSLQADEALVSAYRAGDDSALEILIKRYQTPLWALAFKLSFSKDKSFIDDIIQIALFTIFRLIKDGRFIPREAGLPAGQAGSFKTWAFNMTRNITLNENQRRKRIEKTITEPYLESFSDEMMVRRVDSSMRRGADEKYLARLPEAIGQLKPLDQRLLQLRQGNVPYDQIIRDEPEFRDYKSGQLMVRYYRILEFLRKYLLESIVTSSK